MKEILQDCRRQLGAAPRHYSIVRWSEWQLHPPHWVDDARYKPFEEIYENQRLLREHGSVVWSSVVLAKSSLFKSGFDNSIAYCLYSLDPWFDDNVSVLRGLSRQVLDMKGKSFSEPALSDFSSALAEENAAYAHLRLPPGMTHQREVFATTIVVHRKHLPAGLLQFKFLPLLVRPDRTKASMILPQNFWPEDFLSAWKQGSTKALRPSCRERAPAE